MDEIKNVVDKIKFSTVDLISEKELNNKLENSKKTNKPLRIKLGIDPTKPDIHLGHVVVLKKMREFQEAGHTAIALIGDYTARIGDPSGKNEMRKMLSEEDIEFATQTYLDQIGKILLSDNLEVRRNSEWLGELTFADTLKLTSKATLAQMLARNDFNDRYTSGLPLSLVELMYPLMQGYDSIALEADVELGGTDQLFNLHMGRHLQEQDGKEPQVIITTPLLVGLDGVHKMSKSLDNYIGIDEKPNIQFAKVMSIPDSLIMNYAQYAAFYDATTLKEFEPEVKENPNQSKRKIAKAIADLYWGSGAGEEAEKEFNKVFKEKSVPTDIPTFDISDLEDLRLSKVLVATGMATSGKEATRSVQQGGVKVDGNKIDDVNFLVNVGCVIQVGKRKWVKVK